jgi:Mn2+/Fe2+ NRAMP family transporter
LVAGSGFGFDLLWVLLFAGAATLLLQDMAARLGAGGGVGLGEALMARAKNVWLRRGIALLLLLAIALGNAAYEGGNLRGGGLGLAALTGGEQAARWPVVLLAAFAAGLLLSGSYRLIEKVLMALVGLMSTAFLAAAILVRPDPLALFAGLRPDLPEGATLSAMALLGTTIVPYNLFLHAAAAKRRFAGNASDARRDSAVAIGLGLLVSVAILVSAAAGGVLSEGTPVTEALTESFGMSGRILLATGLLAAGLTSAVTAPLAAGYVLQELAPGRWPSGLILRSTGLGIIVLGLVFAVTAISPAALIVIAQATNAVLLPIVAGFLLWAMNDGELLGASGNGPFTNLAGGLTIVVTLLIAMRGLGRVMGTG